MKAKEAQAKFFGELKKYFKEVEKEWSISRNATDALNRNSNRYTPRIDLAIGPFNVVQTPGGIDRDILNTFNNAPKAIQQIFQGLSKNPNPRCTLAIEISFSGSSKHILGDIANASIIGLFGLVITNDKTDKKARRINEYINKIKMLGKAPEGLFANVKIVKTDEFLNIFIGQKIFSIILPTNTHKI